MNATDRLATTPAVSANTATSRTASARQGALVGAHASTTTSAVCAAADTPPQAVPSSPASPRPA
jgi:hypothetical protein